VQVYESSLWTTSLTLGPTSMAFDHTEAKLDAFNLFPLFTVRVGMSDVYDGGATSFIDLPLPRKYASMQELMASDEFVPTHAGRSAWLGLAGADEEEALEQGCNREGFNTKVSNSPGNDVYLSVRVGVLAGPTFEWGPGEPSCQPGYMQSFIGLGAKSFQSVLWPCNSPLSWGASFSTGALAHICGWWDGSGRWQVFRPKMGYLLGGNAPPASPPPSPPPPSPPAPSPSPPPPPPPSPLPPPSPPPQPPVPLSPPQSSIIVAGYYHTCMASLITDGMQCWGANWNGQLGDGTTFDQCVPTSVAGLSSPGIAAVAAGYGHTCALLASTGGAQCWGYNAHGQLGDGTTNEQLVPTTSVLGLSSGVAAIAAGEVHTCALLASTGGVQCWGYNEHGQLGDGTASNQVVPTTVAGLSSGVAAIGLGAYHTCALLASTGGVQCWGYNGMGQLGDGTANHQLVPTSVAGLSSGVAAIELGAYHTCALLASTGGVQCWGYNHQGQLGDGAPGYSQPVPTNVIIS
jgi:hypothetical protein